MIIMHIFHKWKYIYELKDYKFLGNRLKYKKRLFRECSVCGKIQERVVGIFSDFWVTLTDEETAIVTKELINGKLIY